jgi:hypothetical protein
LNRFTNVEPAALILITRGKPIGSVEVAGKVADRVLILYSIRVDSDVGELSWSRPPIDSPVRYKNQCVQDS